MAVTWQKVRAQARRSARDHGGPGAERLLPAALAEALETVWPRLWALHPEAFHADGVLAGEPPALPSPLLDASPLGIDDAWAGVVAIGVAGAAMEAEAPPGALSGLGIGAEEAAGEARRHEERVRDLWAAFAAGLTGMGTTTRGRR